MLNEHFLCISWQFFHFFSLTVFVERSGFVNYKINCKPFFEFDFKSLKRLSKVGCSILGAFFTSSGTKAFQLVSVLKFQLEMTKTFQTIAFQMKFSIYNLFSIELGAICSLSIDRFFRIFLASQSTEIINRFHLSLESIVIFVRNFSHCFNGIITLVDSSRIRKKKRRELSAHE